MADQRSNTPTGLAASAPVPGRGRHPAPARRRRASSRDYAGQDLAAWLADRRWRAALESYSCLVEPDRDRPDLPGRGSAA